MEQSSLEIKDKTTIKTKAEYSCFGYIEFPRNI